MHHICNWCEQYSVRRSTLTAASSNNSAGVLQLRLLHLLRSGRSLLHHEPGLCGRFGEIVLQLGRAPLETGDCPADVTVSDGVGQAVPVGHDCRRERNMSARLVNDGKTKLPHLRRIPSRRSRERTAETSRAPSGSSFQTPRPCRFRGRVHPP